MKLNKPRAMPRITCFQQARVSPQPMFVLIKMSLASGLSQGGRAGQAGEAVQGGRRFVRR